MPPQQALKLKNHRSMYKKCEQLWTCKFPDSSMVQCPIPSNICIFRTCYVAQRYDQSRRATPEIPRDSWWRTAGHPTCYPSNPAATPLERLSAHSLFVPSFPLSLCLCLASAPQLPISHAPKIYRNVTWRLLSPLCHRFGRDQPGRIHWIHLPTIAFPLLSIQWHRDAKGGG